MGDVNTHMPSTGAEVELVDADTWMTMSITDLFDQRIILNNRLAACAQYGNPNMLRQMQAGIKQIDMILNHKEKHNRKNTNKRQKDIVGLI